MSVWTCRPDDGAERLQSAHERLLSALDRAAATHTRAADLFRSRGYDAKAALEAALAHGAAVQAGELRSHGPPVTIRHEAGTVTPTGQHPPRPSHPSVADPTTVVAGMEVLGLTALDLWLQYVGLGGSLTTSDTERFVAGRGSLLSTEYNLLVLALNEAFADQGLGHPAPYASDI